MGAVQPRGNRPPFVYRPSPARIRAPFRVLGALVGLAILGTPVLVVWETVLSVRRDGWSGAPALLGIAAVFGLMAPWGLKMLRAARTGVDPFSEKKVMEYEASRAMLEAVERTGTQPGPPGLFGPG